jgi:hypothetical protein
VADLRFGSKRRHRLNIRLSPPYSQERTYSDHCGMSALCRSGSETDAINLGRDQPWRIGLEYDRAASLALDQKQTWDDRGGWVRFTAESGHSQVSCYAISRPVAEPAALGRYAQSSVEGQRDPLSQLPPNRDRRLSWLNGPPVSASTRNSLRCWSVEFA